MLCGIAQMQIGEGVWYPMGGTRAVPQALERLAGELGVRVRSGVDVARIVTEGGRARAVETAGGERLDCDAVVSNMDSVRTYRELVGGKAWDSFSRARRREAACSGVVLYLGLDRAYEHLAHHDFVFSRDAEVVEAGRTALRMMGSIEALIAVSLILAQALYGAGNSKYVMVVEMVLHMTCLVPLAYVLGIVLDFGLNGVWASAVVYIGLMSAAMARKFASGDWKDIKL